MFDQHTVWRTVGGRGKPSGIVGLNADRFVPGHGDVQTKAEVQTRVAAATEKRAKIAELVIRERYSRRLRRFTYPTSPNTDATANPLVGP